MNSWKRYIPEGTKDILFEDCGSKAKVIDKLRKLYISKGYSEIISPTLEFYDVFCGDNELMGQEKMYKLFDNMGRILVLRPDMTTPIARIAATKLKEATYPLRIFYNGNIFRVNEIWNGKDSEITQSGIEILGAQNSKTDSEVVITAIESLLTLGLKDFQIEIGQAEFFKGLIEDINMDSEELEKLRGLIENKNYTALREFVQAKDKIISKRDAEALKILPELFGGIDILSKARQLTNNERAINAVDNIEKVYKKVDSLGLGSYISIDLGMVQHIHYYTGLTFRGYSNDASSKILSGGRYDNLIAQFGSDVPAIGFAVDVDSIMQVLQKQGQSNKDFQDRLLIHYKDEFLNTAYGLANKLRQRGLTVELSLFEEEEDAINYGEQKRIKRVVSLLDDDSIKVIDMESKNSINTDMWNFTSILGDFNETDKNCTDKR